MVLSSEDTCSLGNVIEDSEVSDEGSDESILLSVGGVAVTGVTVSARDHDTKRP